MKAINFKLIVDKIVLRLVHLFIEGDLRSGLVIAERQPEGTEIALQLQIDKMRKWSKRRIKLKLAWECVSVKNRNQNKFGLPRASKSKNAKLKIIPRPETCRCHWQAPETAQQLRELGTKRNAQARFCTWSENIFCHGFNKLI